MTAKRITSQPPTVKRRLPRSLKELTPSNHFAPRIFFQEMILKTLFTRRTGEHRKPDFPKLETGQVALTWIGHASFLIQFAELNVLVDPNFANWLFLLKRLKRSGLKLKDLPHVDLVLLTHAHYDHFHRPSLRKLPPPKMGIMPWNMARLTQGLRFTRVLELQWWESFGHADWKVTLVPAKHWGARYLRDLNRGYGGFVLECQGHKIYHAGDTGYFDGFQEIGRRLAPEIAILPIGAYHPDSFRHGHMGPEEAVRAFADLNAKWLVPMHYGTFKLSFEAMDEPPRLLKELAHRHGVARHLRFLEEGIPRLF